MLGCFDTKGEDYSFLYKCFKEHCEGIITINTGVMETAVDFPIDFNQDQVAMEAGHSILDLKTDKDRGHAVDIMGTGLRLIVKHDEHVWD